MGSILSNQNAHVASLLNALNVKQLKNQQVLIVGAGVTGLSCAKVLTDLGADVTLLDEKTINTKFPLITSVEEITSDKNFQFAVVSPGWRLDHPFILQLQKKSILTISEVDLAWLLRQEFAPNQKWIALTGTNGKTTTIQMVQSIFSAAKINGRACGNVGETVIESVVQKPALDYLALELSSFQISWSHLPKFEAISILNIAEDHIDWHGSFDSYADAKLKLCKLSNTLILNKSDPEITGRINKNSKPTDNQKIVWFSLNTPKAGEIGLVENLIVDRSYTSKLPAVNESGEAKEIAELSDIKPTVPHNVMNAMAAAGLCLSIGISHHDIKTGLNQFQTDHHRLELVAKVDEVSWIDDSKATNPHSAQAALLANLNVIWIAGGLAKGAKMDELIINCKQRIKAAILIGQDRDLIVQALKQHAPQIPISLIDADSPASIMEKVVKKASEIAQPNDTVLLAPACASMDQFKSYAQRGDLFASAVKSNLKLANV